MIIQLSQLNAIQASILTVAVGSRSFARKFTKNGFKYKALERKDIQVAKSDDERCISCMPRGLFHGQNIVVFDISNVLMYNTGIANSIIEAYIDNDLGKEVHVVIKSRIIGLDFNKFLPNLIRPVYNWSHPFSVSGIESLLLRVFNSNPSIFSNAYVLHIHMVNYKMVWDIHKEDSVLRNSIDGISKIKNLNYYANQLINELDLVEIPVKEIFVVGKNRTINGGCISRKCEDGEYVLTVY